MNFKGERLVFTVTHTYENMKNPFILLQGDSGGPLQLYINGNWIQIGIVSFAIRCAEPGHPGVYTRLTEFLPWIHSNMI